MLEALADLTPIVDQLFRLKPRSTVCLWRRALDNVRWTGQVIWTELTEEIESYRRLAEERKISEDAREELERASATAGYWR